MRATTSLHLQQALQCPLLVVPDNPSVQQGISMQQRRKHLYILTDVWTIIGRMAKISTDVGLAYVMALGKLREDRQWTSPTTIATQAECLHGALIRLNQYTNMSGFDPATSSSWADAMRKWRKDLDAHCPLRTALTPQAWMDTVARATPACQALLTLTWATTGRLGNWFRVKREDVKLTKEATGGYALSALWKEHKTVAKTGPYTVHSWLPEKHGQMVVKYLAKEDREWLFPLGRKEGLFAEVRKLLKRINPHLEVRSLRRGALQAIWPTARCPWRRSSYSADTGAC